MIHAKRHALAAGIVATFLTPVAAQAAWVSTASKALPLDSSVVTTPAAATMPVHIVVTLPIRNKSELDALVASENTPGTPGFGHPLTFAQFQTFYAPGADQLQSVSNYLASFGFTNIKTLANRLYISADGTAAQAEAAFNTQIVQYAISGVPFYVNTADIQVPDTLSSSVVAVVGLQNAVHPRLANKQKINAKTKAGVPVTNISACNPNGSVFVGVPPVPLNCFTPQQFDMVYDAQTVGIDSQSVPVNIGIFTTGDLHHTIDDLTTAELAEYPNLTPRTVGNGIVLPEGIAPSTSTSGTGEFDMDTQDSTGIAGGPKGPGSAVNDLYIFAAKSLNDSDAIVMFADWVALMGPDGRPLVKAGSYSVGGCDILEAVSGGIPTFDAVYEEAAAQGQTLFASSGDNGSAGCAPVDVNGVPDGGVPGQVSYPASSPWVMGAGGTTLTVDDTETRVAEIAWVGSGGGISTVEPSPSWQAPVLPTATVTGATGVGGRGVPDVAMDGDVTSAAVVYDYCASKCGPSGTGAAGAYPGPDAGTSLASPLSVGAWARILAEQCAPDVFAGPALYSLASLASVTGFFDIIVGNNGAYNALPGYDMVTGLGVFDMNNINSALNIRPKVCTSSVVNNLLPPVAALTSDVSSGTAPLTVNFNASGSSTPNSGATIVSYTFSFGDGSSAVTQAAATIEHTYTTAGSYTATVSVTDSDAEASTTDATESITTTTTATTPTPPVTASTPASPSGGAAAMSPFKLIVLGSMGLLASVRRRRRRTSGAV